MDRPEIYWTGASGKKYGYWSEQLPYQCATRKGATHVHLHRNATKRDRLDEESDLLAGHSDAYAPIGCNQKPGG